MEKVTVYRTTGGSLIEDEIKAQERDFQDRLEALLSVRCGGGGGTGHGPVYSGGGENVVVVGGYLQVKTILEQADAVIELLNEYKLSRQEVYGGACR